MKISLHDKTGILIKNNINHTLCMNVCLERNLILIPAFIFLQSTYNYCLA